MEKAKILIVEDESIKEPPTSHFSALYIYSSISIVALITIIMISFSWNYFNERDQIISLAKKEALTNFNKDIALRYWATGHGGVYVPATEQTPPNPYLDNVPERDITTPSGKKLTLMNPAYMIRQVMEGYEKLYGVKGHITSLKLLNPKNKPDQWEQQALKDFEKGVKEVFEVANLSGEPYLRLIRPLVTKEGCLKCHLHQGYEVGDVRGGVSVSVPLLPYNKLEQDAIYRIIVIHILFGLLGVLAILLIALQNRKRIIVQKATEEEIRQINLGLEKRVKERTTEIETLLQEIHHRVKNNMAVVSSLLKLQANNIEDEGIKEILKESQSRVYAMSAVHETLHGSKNLSEIDLKTYLSKVTSSIFQTYSISSDKVKLNTDINGIPISIDQASPLGLVINELLSNSLKYAFPDERKGEINVSMKKLNKELELKVMDNGVGMPKGLDWKNSNSLGLKLVRTLVENQLDGSLDVTNRIHNCQKPHSASNLNHII
jgi:two-component sensor histidine kinase